MLIRTFKSKNILRIINMTLQGRKKFLCSKLLVVMILSFISVSALYADENSDANVPSQNIQEEEIITDDNSAFDKEKLKNVKKIAKEKNEKKEVKNVEATKDPIDMYGIKMLKALGIVIGALLIVLAFVKKTYKVKNNLMQNGKIKVLESKSLDTRSKVCLIEVEGEKVLVGITNDSISMLNVGKNNHFDELIKDDLDKLKDNA